MQLLLFLGMAFGMFLIASLIGVTILSKTTGIALTDLQNSATWKMNDPRIVTFMRSMILLQFLFLFTIPVLLFSYFADPKPAQFLGLKAPSHGVYWIWGLLLIVVSYPFVEYLGFINQKIPVGGDTQKWMKGMEEEAARQIRFMLNNRTPLELLKNLVFIALFAGIGEELFFRGILQRLFIRMTHNPWLGIILTAVIFSGIHFQFYGFLPRVFLGILLGAIYWYSGSLWIAILAHFLYDAAVIVIVYFNPQLLANTEATLIKGQEVQLLIGAMISLALAFAILQRMQRKSVASYEAVYSDDFPKQRDDFSF